MNFTVMRVAVCALGVLGAFGALVLAGCGGGGSGPDLSEEPTGVLWQEYQGVTLPHTEQGPKRVAGGAATGFEQSPRGAAVAAITHTVRLSVAADGQWAPVVRDEVVPSPARDEWAVNRVQLSITGPAAPEYAPHLLGYLITSYSDEQAGVDIFTEYSDGSRAVNHTAVQWFNEDWRLRLPDPDSTVRPIDAISALPTDIVTLEAPT